MEFDGIGVCLKKVWHCCCKIFGWSCTTLLKEETDGCTWVNSNISYVQHWSSRLDVKQATVHVLWLIRALNQLQNCYYYASSSNYDSSHLRWTDFILPPNLFMTWLPHITQAAEKKKNFTGPPRQSCLSLWNVVGALHRPKAILVNWYIPVELMKAVYFCSFSLRVLCPHPSLIGSKVGHLPALLKQDGLIPQSDNIQALAMAQNTHAPSSVLTCAVGSTGSKNLFLFSHSSDPSGKESQLLSAVDQHWRRPSWQCWI